MFKSIVLILSVASMAQARRPVCASTVAAGGGPYRGSSRSLLDAAQCHLQAQGDSHRRQHLAEDFSTSAPATLTKKLRGAGEIVLLPDPSKKIGRIAHFLKEKLATKLIYSPRVLRAFAAGALFSNDSKSIYIDAAFLFDPSRVENLRHEALHAFKERKAQLGLADPDHFYLSSPNSGLDFDLLRTQEFGSYDRLWLYDDFMGADETSSNIADIFSAYLE